MLHKCANPACPSVFRNLSEGKIFLLELEPADAVGRPLPGSRRERAVHRVERFWLCDGCSSLLTLTFERGRGMVTVPLPARNSHAPVLHLKSLHPTKGAERAL
jgi:hypothetical protein